MKEKVAMIVFTFRIDDKQDSNLTVDPMSKVNRKIQRDIHNAKVE